MIEDFNIDVMNTPLQGMVASILLIDDMREQAVWLAELSFWLSTGGYPCGASADGELGDELGGSRAASR